MKPTIVVLALLLTSWPLAAQDVIVKRGYSPELPAAAKWVGTKTPLRIEDLKGKVLVVHFWKTQSDPCEQNFKFFDSWLEHYGKELRVIGIHGPDENNPEFADVEKKALARAKTFPTAIDDTDLAMKAWKVETVPTTFLVDRKGMLRYAWEGQIAYKRIRGDLLLEKKIDELIREK